MNEEGALRAALFVDFDNIFLSFEALGPEAARRFATRPVRWLAWFERGLHAPPEEPGRPTCRRRILVRRCYLNPVQFGRFRADYLRAAFSIVDCPPLTTRGKTSADIYMVMDMIDALAHPTRFDEFIILSSDADFTPVLLRLRTHDRSSAILCRNLAAAAYKAACDQVVSHERFFSEALGLDGGGTIEVAQEKEADPYAEVLPRLAEALRTTVERNGEIAASDLPQLFGRFPEFRASSWFGRRSLKGLVVDLLAVRQDLAMTEGSEGNWAVALGVTKPMRRDASRAAQVADEGGLGAGWGRVGPDLAPVVRRLVDMTGVPSLEGGAWGVLFEELAAVVEGGGRGLAEVARSVEERALRRGARITRQQVGFVLSSFLYHGPSLDGRSAADLRSAWRARVEELCANAQIELGTAEEGALDRWRGGRRVGAGCVVEVNDRGSPSDGVVDRPT